MPTPKNGWVYYLFNVYLVMLTIQMDYLSHCTYARFTRFLVCLLYLAQDKYTLFVIRGILAAIDTFSDHALVGVSTSRDVSLILFQLIATKRSTALVFFQDFYTFSLQKVFITILEGRNYENLTCKSISPLQIFYFVGFALFCLETLVSIWVLQVCNLSIFHVCHSFPSRL